jgi:hypothetical protein
MTRDHRKTMDEIILDYLLDRDALPDEQPAERPIPKIIRARRVRFEPGGRLAFADDREANPNELIALNALSWIVVSGIEGFAGFSHLIKAHNLLLLAEFEGREER